MCILHITLIIPDFIKVLHLLIELTRVVGWGYKMADEAVRPCSFATGKIPERTLLGEKSFLRKATEKKEQKIKPENHAPRKRGVIALAISGEIFVKRVFSRERFSAVDL